MKQKIHEVQIASASASNKSASPAVRIRPAPRSRNAPKAGRHARTTAGEAEARFESEQGDSVPAPLNVLVLGMHRSGTSAVSQALRAAGLSAGLKSGLMDPEPQNPAGFGERLDVALFNDRLLASLEWFWDAPDPSPLADPPLRPEFVAEGRRIIEQNLAGPHPFVLKDPRISLLLPWWRQILFDRFVPIVVLRSPAEVAWSLKVRDGFPMELGLALWAAYHRHIAAGLDGMPWVAVDYEALCNKPQSTVDGLLKSLSRLGVKATMDSRAGARQIRPLLRRPTQPRDVDLNPQAIAAIADIRSQWPHDAVSVQAAFEPSAAAPSEWEKAILSVHRRALEAMTNAEETRGKLLKAEAMLGTLSARQVELEREAAGLRSERASLAQQLESIERNREAARSTAAELEARMSALTGRYAELERVAAQQNSDGSAARQKLENTTRERDAARAQLADAEVRLKELNEIHGSLSAAHEQVLVNWGQLEDDARQLREERDSADRERNTARAEFAQLERRLGIVNAEHADLGRTSADLRQRVDDLISQGETSRATVARLERKAAAQSSEVALLRQQINFVSTERDAAQATVSTLDARVSALTDERAQLDRVAVELRGETALLRQRVEYTERERDVAQSELTQIGARIEAAETRNRELVGLLAGVDAQRLELERMLGALREQFSDVADNRDQLQASLIHLETQLEQQSNERAQLESEATSLRDELVLQRAAIDDRATLAITAAGLRDQIHIVGSERDAATTALAALEVRFGALAADRAQLNGAVDELIAERAALRDEFAKAVEEREDVDARTAALESRIRHLSQQRSELEGAAASLQVELTSSRRQAAAAGNDRDALRPKITELAATIAGLRDERATLERTAGELRADGAGLREQLQQTHHQLAQRGEELRQSDEERSRLASEVVGLSQRHETLANHAATTENELSAARSELEAQRATKLELEELVEPRSRLSSGSTRSFARRIRDGYWRSVAHMPQSVVGLIWHNPLFDAEWYLQQNPDVRNLTIGPEMHFRRHGVKELRKPNAVFETGWYMEQYPDAARRGLNPLDDYLVHSVSEGRNPSAYFETSWYLATNPDVADSGMNPLLHYLRHGVSDGRVTNPYGHVPPKSPSVTASDVMPKLQAPTAAPIAPTAGEPGPVLAQSPALMRSSAAEKDETESPPAPPAVQSSPSASAVRANGHTKEPAPIANDVRVIALYRSAYYWERDPASDLDLGSEWMTVAKARPLVDGQRQPHVPGDLGFYDQRLAETRREQADLARSYGINGFCYQETWGYPDRYTQPFRDMLRSGEPAFPFTLRMTIEPLLTLKPVISALTVKWLKGNISQVRKALEALGDPRAIRVDDRPLFLVEGLDAAEGRRAAAAIRREASRVGLPGVFVVAPMATGNAVSSAHEIGVDALLAVHPNTALVDWLKRPANGAHAKGLSVLPYDAYASKARVDGAARDSYQTILCGWDEAPLNGRGSLVLTDFTPEAYGEWLRAAVSSARDLHQRDRRFVFVASWNDWAHGAHLEPDITHGHAYLESTRGSLSAPIWSPEELT